MLTYGARWTKMNRNRSRFPLLIERSLFRDKPSASTRDSSRCRPSQSRVVTPRSVSFGVAVEYPATRRFAYGAAFCQLCTSPETHQVVRVLTMSCSSSPRRCDIRSKLRRTGTMNGRRLAWRAGTLLLLIPALFAGAMSAMATTGSAPLAQDGVTATPPDSRRRNRPKSGPRRK